jgi:hypothetical protein
MFRVLVPVQQLHAIDWDELDQILLDNYERALTAYLRHREQVPSGQLAEARYEELEADPVGVLRAVYEQLGIPGFDRAEPSVRAYTNGLSGYRKNRFKPDQATLDLVTERWRFALEAFGYPQRVANRQPAAASAANAAR